MKSSCNHPVWLLVLLAGFTAVTVLRAADGDAASVLSPGKRQEAVDQARQLLAHRDIVPVTADPFHPEAFNEFVAATGHVPGPATPGEAPAAPAAPRTEHDILQTITAGLKPSGFFVIGGQPVLLFGQKRVKAGGTLTINFEGSEYIVEITTITPPNFTLRLNREEFTRTIK